MRRLYFFTFILLISLFPCPPAIAGETAVRSWWPYAFPPKDSAAYEKISTATHDLLSLLPALDGKSVPEKADAIRIFLNNHSQHLIDDEFYSHWDDIPYMMALIKKNADDKTQKRPHMECATRSSVMHHMLSALGINSRIIIVHHEASPGITHTFLEIYDPATRQWTLQDPDPNIYWIRNSDQGRATIEEMLALPIRQNFTPCETKDKCGYEDRLEAYLPYFALATRFHPYDSNEILLSHNPERFARMRLMLRFVNTPVFCALYKKSCAFIMDEIHETSL